MPTRLVAEARKRMAPVVETALRLCRERRDERALDVLAAYLAGNISRSQALARLQALTGDGKRG
jgi:hypothetical protein